ncbi:nucleotidyltransferase domain-containing protein [Georgenia alba]|uniref:Nucleotidyltransferase domain-containing protein n=1 Tax=Georgenia alba TaxID=2233858 RepID=A0ABW2Q892_9MICO
MEVLRDARVRAGMTQQELADVSGVARANIAAYESGARPLTPAMNARLLAAIRRPSDSLAEHADEVRAILAAAGARNPRVFGSVARGTDSATSDIDLVVDLDGDADAFTLAGAWRRVVDLVGHHVDLVPSSGLEARRSRILDEAIPL